MRTSAWAAGAAAAIGLAGWNSASAQNGLPLYCLDSTGKAQRFKYADSETLRLGYKQRFHWNDSLSSLGPNHGRLVFSQDGTLRSPEYIAYDVDPHEGGMLLRKMHIHLEGRVENVTGNEMCVKTDMVALGK